MSSHYNSTLICHEIVIDESQNIQLSKRTLDSLKLDRRYQEEKKKKREITGNAEINCLMVVCLCITFSIAGMG